MNYSTFVGLADPKIFEACPATAFDTYPLCGSEGHLWGNSPPGQLPVGSFEGMRQPFFGLILLDFSQNIQYHSHI